MFLKSNEKYYEFKKKTDAHLALKNGNQKTHVYGVVPLHATRC